MRSHSASPPPHRASLHILSTLRRGPREQSLAAPGSSATLSIPLLALRGRTVSCGVPSEVLHTDTHLQPSCLASLCEQGHRRCPMQARPSASRIALVRACHTPTWHLLVLRSQRPSGAQLEWVSPCSGTDRAPCAPRLSLVCPCAGSFTCSRFPSPALAVSSPVNTGSYSCLREHRSSLAHARCLPSVYDC